MAPDEIVSNVKINDSYDEIRSGMGTCWIMEDEKVADSIVMLKRSGSIDIE